MESLTGNATRFQFPFPLRETIETELVMSVVQNIDIPKTVKHAKQFILRL